MSRERWADGHIVGSFGEELAEGAIRIDVAHDRDPHPRTHAELVDERRRIRPLHPRIVPPRYRPAMATPPLLVFGPRSLTYDFGPSHPLTPRRFGPGIELLREVGAVPGLEPEPASDDDLFLCHTPQYVAAVKRLSELDNDPWAAPEAGIGPGDNPPFPGMHDAAAAVAGGSLRAIEAILRGDIIHAFHPGGGLHHAMASRASGFCIYNDPALAIAKARQAGLRVLYVDLDVHHGDGVEEIHRDDPGVLTVSIHESGRYLFPGTGAVSEVGDGVAAGSVVNVPLEPETGERAWLSAVETLLPELASAFGPDIVVSQHGCDTHAWDPLAHLNVTTTAMGAAARLVDAISHRWATGRWLATGGGGYGVYRVVPRAWSLTSGWQALTAMRRTGCRRRGGHAGPRRLGRFGDPSLPEAFDDPPNAGVPVDASQRDAENRSLAIAELARVVAVPRLIRAAVDRRWWAPLGPPLPPDADDVGAGGVTTRPGGDPRRRRPGDARRSRPRAAPRREPRRPPAARHSRGATARPDDGGRRDARPSGSSRPSSTIRRSLTPPALFWRSAWRLRTAGKGWRHACSRRTSGRSATP